jgi:hypothetical protein
MSDEFLKASDLKRLRESTKEVLWVAEKGLGNPEHTEGLNGGRN